MKKGASWTYDTPSFIDSTIILDIQQVAVNKQNRQQPVDDFKLLVPNSSSTCGSGTG